MSNTLANKSHDDLLQMGEIICRGRDWHWVAIWAYNIHRLFRQRMKPRKVWDDLDSLIRVECDWHLARDLFARIRQLTLAQEKEEPDAAEHAYLLLGEVTAKAISNARRGPVIPAGKGKMMHACSGRSWRITRVRWRNVPAGLALRVAGTGIGPSPAPAV